MTNNATLELPSPLHKQLLSLAEAEQVPVELLIERMLAARPRPLPMAAQGTILGEAVPHEEIHVWDRSYDQTYSTYVGDYAD